MGVVQELTSPLDHPKINIPSEELNRINETLNMYSNKYPEVSYLNSNKELKKRQYKTLNMIKESSNLLASLLFNEKCKITISNDGASNFIDQVLRQNKFYDNFGEYLEPMFALGGLAVRPYVDSNSKIKFGWCLANTFFPLKSNTNEISEGVIITKTTKVEKKKTIYYTLFEFHEWESGKYIITNELYRSENQNIVGTQVNLRVLYDDLEPTAVIGGLEKPLFTYLKPAGFNNINPSSPLGLGICDNAKPTLEQINDAYDAFNWEIKMGERKIGVPEGMTRVRVDEQGNLKQVFDDTTNIFVALAMDRDTKPVDFTSDIRAESFIRSINQFFRTLEMQIKLSEGTFTFDGNSLKTATEVISEDSQTFRTRNSQVSKVETFIKDLIIATLELASRTSDGAGMLYSGELPTHDDIEIDFDDGIFQSKGDKLKHYSQAVLSDLMPHVIAIARLHNLPIEEAEKWFKMIQQEKRGIMPNPSEGVEL